MLSLVRLDNLWILILFILFTAFINLIMVSSTSKWAFMSFIFIPVLTGMGVSPDMTQCAYRIGDSATNAITPFMFYMPLVLTYMQQYDSNPHMVRYLNTRGGIHWLSLLPGLLYLCFGMFASYR